MFSVARILVPVDFSQRCAGAARYAEALVERYGASATLLHVIPRPYYDFVGFGGEGVVVGQAYADRAADLKAEFETFMHKEVPNLKAGSIVVQEGDPATLIVNYAHDNGMDMILMPTHGYGPFRRFVVGSVTAKVLHDADCPVWTGVHMEEAPPVDAIAFRTVMAALDLGPQSERTLAWAAQFACNHQARLVITHATFDLEGRAGEYFDPNWRIHFTRLAQESIVKLQRAAGTNGEVHVEAGPAPQVVCSAAQECGADLLVIGRGSASGVFGRLRANAYSIIRQSPCPVVSV